MSSPQHTSPVISRQASPERRLSRSRSRSRSRSPSPVPTRRRSASRSPDSRSLSRSASPQRRTRSRSRCSRSSCSSHSDEEEEVAAMDARKFKSLSRRGQRAYTRRAKEHNAMLEHRYVTLLQTLYKEVCGRAV